MPYMFGEQPQKRINLDVGNLNVDIAPVTAGELKERNWDTRAENLVIPAGAYSVHVRHNDPTGGTITVNGNEIRFGRYFSRGDREDLVNRKQDFTPEVTVANPDGRLLSISVSYPSSSPVNPDLL